MFQSINSEVTTNTALTISYSKDYNLFSVPVYGASVQAVYTDATPAAKSFVAANVKTNVQSPASSITITTHGFSTGLKVALTGTNLPTGLSATNYYVIVIDANTISLADTLAHAQAGTKIAITAAGTTADALLTPAVLGGVVVKLQMSNDGTNFTDISGMTVTISAAGSVLWDLGAVTFRVLRVLETPSAGSLNLTLNYNGINDF